MEDPVAYVKGLFDVLKSGATLIISTPNANSLAAKLFKGRYRLLGMPHRMLFNPDNLSHVLRSSGFVVEEVRFPFFDTPYFNFKNLIRLLFLHKMSPPFYGSIMTFVVRKP